MQEDGTLKREGTSENRRSAQKSIEIWLRMGINIMDHSIPGAVPGDGSATFFGKGDAEIAVGGLLPTRTQIDMKP
jgi:hypothetical protein